MDSAPNAFSSIATKIGHPLEEIRVRAFKNILQKLELGIASERQLASDDHFLRSLLQWFNFTDPPPLGRDVLQLLIQLSKHSEACERLGRLSAVEFLSKLRLNIVEELRPSIDLILENLFLLPDVSLLTETPNETHSKGEALVENDVPSVEHEERDELQHFSGFTLVSLKWVSVSKTDLRILQSTNSSLESDDVQLTMNSCNFLTDVVVRDFPVEVFLQFSKIPRNLIRILSSNAKEPHRKGLHVLGCLSTLIQSLLARVKCCRDVAMYNTKRETIGSSDSSGGSLDSRPSGSGRSDTRPRGDGQDGDVSPSDEVTSPEFDDGWTDRSQEISVPDFCLLVLEHSVLLLNTPNPQVIYAVIEVVDVAVSLLSECITIRIWQDPSDAARRVRAKLLECYDSLASIVVKQSGKCVSSEGNAFKVHVAVARCAASVWAKLLQVSVSPTQVCGIGITPTCVAAFTLLSLDFALANTDAQLHRVFLGYVRTLGSEAYGVHSMAVESYESLKTAIRFVQTESSRPSSEMNECEDLLDLADDALLALNHYDYWEFVTRCIQFLSNFSTSDRSTDIFTKLLSHPQIQTRKIVFKSCLQLLEVSQKSLSDRHNPNLRFLLNTKILICLIRHGLGTTDREISEMGSDILMHFLNGKTWMAPELWKHFLDALVPILPLVQAHTDVNATRLGIALFRFVDTDNKWLSAIDTLRCNLRLLFSKDVRLRSQVVPRIVWYLAKEENALAKLPPLSKLDASPLASLFLQHGERSSRQLLRPSRSYTSNEQVEKLLERFASEDGDGLARKAAGQQLAFLVNDEAAFRTFETNEGINRVKTVVQQSLTNDLVETTEVANNTQLIPVALELLRNAVFYDRTASRSLCVDESFYYSLLRAALVFRDDKQVCGDVADILASFLFRDAFRFGSRLLFERFDLPLREYATDENDEEQPPFLKLTPTDPLVRSSLETYKRYAWNAAMVGGWKNLTTTETFAQSEQFGLSETDRRLIASTRLDRTINSLFEEIIAATAHKPILVALKFLILDLSSNQVQPLHLEVVLFERSFSRFLKVYPKSTADKTLVRHILQFFTFILRWQRPLDLKLTDWMYEQFLVKDGALYNLTRHPHADQPHETEDRSVYSPLIRELVTFMITLLSNTSVSNQRALYGMIHFVLQHLNLAEAPQFYNLASLEAVLQCLVHVTARSGFSVQKTVAAGRNICRQLTALLMEVVASFHLSRENGTHSFMGRGVTTAATVCLSHVATETRSIANGEAWIKDWFYVHESSEGSSQLGLGWLIPLWTHRDPEVRSASLGIVVGFTTTESGCELVNANIQQVAGGLWGVALSFLLDHSEASIVREQAANMLTNLMSHSMGTGSTPNIHLIGRAAVSALLQNSNFIREMVLTLSSFTPHPWLQSYVQTDSYRVASTSTPSTSCTLISTDFGLTNTSLLVDDLHPPSTQTDPQTNLTSSSHETTPTIKDGFMLADSGLVSAVFLLLRNLVATSATDTLLLMKQESLFECILRILDQSKSVLWSNDTDTSIRSDLVTMHINMILFLGTCCVADPLLRSQTISNSMVLEELLSYLRLPTDRTSETQVHELWSSTYALLTILCSQLFGVQAVNVVDTLHKHIQVILTNLTEVLTPQTPKCLKNTAILWLVQTLSSLGKLSATQGNIANALSTTLDTKGENFETEEPGSQLFRLLFRQYSKISLARENRDDTSNDVFEALGVLLSVSQSAKQTALEDKFLDVIFERLKRNLARLNVNAATEYKQTTKNKDQIHMEDSLQHIDLLTNFLFGNHKCKIAANEQGLTAIVAQLWTSSAVAHRTTVLTLLCTFAANCPSAAKSLALTKANSGPTIGSGSLKGSNGGTFLHEIIKACQSEVTKAAKTTSDNAIVLERLFVLLASVSLNPLCRGIICKSKLLQDFPTTQTTKKSGRLIYKESVLRLWLQLFNNITLKAEGQEVVLNIPDCIETLLDVVENGSRPSRESSFNVLRNLCFHSSAKTKLLANAKFVKTVTSYSLRDEDGGRQQLIAATALWALLANSQKGKTVLKGDNFVHQLEDTLERLRGRDDNPEKDKTLFVLETIRTLITE